ncbi:MAG TPA: alpha/beta fold hydrolase [Verrucomicrobiales bacterium]|nr:alpha/beta fold hydrolase [Verrucomicrobiales bacterium]
MWLIRPEFVARAALRIAPVAAASAAAGCASTAAPPAQVLASPVPPAPRSDSSWVAPDGESFPFTAWVPASNPPSVVIVAAHGLSGAASDFRPLGEYLSRRGCAVYAYELRGMGNDPRLSRRGSIASRGDWLRDFASFAQRIESEWPDAFVVWYGESLGSVIVLQSTLWRHRQQLGPDAVILSAPILATAEKLPRWKAPLVHMLVRTAPWLRIPLVALGGDAAREARVVAATTHEDQTKKTPHALHAFSLHLLGEIGRLVAENKEAAQAFDLPLLVLHGGHDLFTPPEEVRTFVEKGLPAAPRPERRLFPGSYHLLLHDVERKEVLDTVEEWISSQALRQR